MLYCVIRDTTVIADKGDTDEVMSQNIINAGFIAEQVEILTQEQFGARKALESTQATLMTNKERIEELEQMVNISLLGGL